MATAEKGDTVKVHYTGTLDDGAVFDSSVNREPLSFTIGKGQLLPKFEEGVEGLGIGEKTDISIPAAEGYGLRREDLIVKIPVHELPKEIEPEIGIKLQMNTQSGQTVVVTVVDIDKTHMTVDANHELAGENLNFNIELVEIIN